MFKLILLFLLLTSLSACMTKSRYSHKHDSAPSRPPTLLELTDATVTNEPVGRGNQPYSIKGIRYIPFKQREVYSEKGTASWYGRKFHGHLTSNGEIYDMYKMSAAHKTLPLPSFVRVTNLDNNKSTIVRVNDRGPFHEDRIIDLSYAAAYKIGVYANGTAHVHLEVLLPEDVPSPLAVSKPTTTVSTETENTTKPVVTPEPLLNEGAGQYHVKLNKIESVEHANDIGKGLSIMMHQPFQLHQDKETVALLFGPFDSETEAESFSKQLSDYNYEKTIVIVK